LSDPIQLIEKFVHAFGRFDSEVSYADSTLARLVEDDGFVPKIHKVISPPSVLESLYDRLPFRLPPLYEHLILSYRWPQVDLETYTLLANPLGPDLSGLYGELSRDGCLWDALVPAGYLQFGKGPDIDYDPVCFEMKSRGKNRECRIVKIDHEEILCNYRVKVVAELAPSFEMLVHRTIEAAEMKRP